MRTFHLAGVTFALAACVGAQTPCFDRNLGADLGAGDDTVSNVTLSSFAFPFNGGSVTTIGVCSNGYIWLDNGASTVADFSPTEAELLANGPRFCPRWCDLYPPTSGPGGGVFFNEVPAAGSSPARAVITWNRVSYFANNALFLTMQVQLDATGAITVYYDPTSDNDAGPSITGSTAGNGATPNVLNLSAMPFNTGGATGYEVFDIAPGGPFDLTGVAATWLPNGSNGYTGVPNNCPAANFVRYGQGCPRNATVYESFVTGAFDLGNTSIQLVHTAGGYVAQPGPGMDNSFSAQLVGAGDDTIHTGLALGFNFPFGGGSISQVSLCSNGFLWLNGSTLTTYAATVPALLSQGPRICGLWKDLDARPISNPAAQIFWDSSPTRAIGTWVNVANFGVAGSSNTFQIQLRPNGDIILSYGVVDPATTATSPLCIVGMSDGVDLDPGATDLSASVPGLVLGTPGSIPLALDAQAGSNPVVGGPFTMLLGNIPAGTPLAAFVLGFTQLNPGADLSVLGMPGCRRFTTLDANIVVLPLGSPAVPFTLNIPNLAAYIGYSLYAQGASFSAGFNALGVIASNGGAIHMGL